MDELPSNLDLYSDNLSEIVSPPPSWILYRGIGSIIFILLILISMLFFIKYPEIVTGTIKFTTSYSPRTIISRRNGTLAKILVKEGEWVARRTDVAYLESTANHEQVLEILSKLRKIKNRELDVSFLDGILSPDELELGELQSVYGSFFLSYLDYMAVNTSGIYEKRKIFIKNEAENLSQQNDRLGKIYDLQIKELALAESEYEKHQILAKEKVISPLELQQKEAIILNKRQAIPQLENSIISNKGNILAKSKELVELQNEISIEKKKFFQSLNSFISAAEDWKREYVLTSNSDGYLVYDSHLQQDQPVSMYEVLFYVNANRDDYYGEMYISPIAIAKVRNGQAVLIKVRSYPYQEYGYLHGRIAHLGDIPINDSLFFSKISLARMPEDSLIRLKPGMLADAEIITENQSVIKRIWLNITKTLTFRIN